MDLLHLIFVPFLGDLFFNYRVLKPIGAGRLKVFVPFPGDFFSIYAHVRRDAYGRIVFVPFPGDFFSITVMVVPLDGAKQLFSSPFPGTFFQWGKVQMNGIPPLFSSPFPGTFFQSLLRQKNNTKALCFRPLSRGLFFNFDGIAPFIYAGRGGFRPLSRGLFFNSVPAKPQPVCSRKRIRGGDGGIASSGTLLRR